MDLGISAGLSCLVSAGTFTPQKSKYGFDFDHSSSSISNSTRSTACPTRLLFIPVPLENIAQPGAGAARYDCPRYYIPVMHSFPRGGNDNSSNCAGAGSPRVLLYFHGNSACVATKADSFAAVCQQASKAGCDFHVISVEYASYGLASPVARQCTPSRSSSLSCKTHQQQQQQQTIDVMLCPSPASLRAIAHAIIKHLIESCRVNESNIILVGRSMGTGLVLELAARPFRKVRGVALIAPYTGIPRVVGEFAARFVPLGRWLGVSRCVRSLFSLACWLSGHSFFESDKNIKRVRGPITIFHGSKDKTVRIENAEELAEARKKALAEAAAHVPSVTGSEVLSKAIRLDVFPEADHGNVPFEDGLVSFLVSLSKEMDDDETARHEPRADDAKKPDLLQQLQTQHSSRPANIQQQLAADVAAFRSYRLNVTVRLAIFSALATVATAAVVYWASNSYIAPWMAKLKMW